ncbi:MAG TPA: hypothetical protein VKY37_12060 [Brumimicrobium sp.]|nr:hypothetical protein [Brumimicrobium sp.]
MKKIATYASALILLAFGMLTLFLSTSIIFDLFGIRAIEGNYVPLIVWANFLASMLYLIAAYGFFMERKWTVYVLGTAYALLVLAFIYLILYINNGGVYEKKTIGAMTFRTSLTLFFTLLAYYLGKKKK